MFKHPKVFFIPALLFISVLNPGCKHGTNDAMTLYRHYAIKNLVIKNLEKATRHD
ncbi:hypothetical protein [Pedobacter soli]|uniref:Uncharacterized protein n=1 Tax=Pedobacter soli TaxID=390242 RepID=A0A1G6X8W5_9SPHI|nr:hypothetical protein [Pedobacter soli]SDD74629.1 hypothetical protein SAMN04488024_107265 [Pedobacter soli]